MMMNRHNNKFMKKLLKLSDLVYCFVPHVKQSQFSYKKPLRLCTNLIEM